MENYFEDDLVDKRLDYRGNMFLDSLHKGQTSDINTLFTDIASKKGGHRFLSNPSISENELLSVAAKKCLSAAKNSHILCIQDTSEIKLTPIIAKLRKGDPSIGPIGTHKDFGFYIHPALVVSATDSFPLGLAATTIYNRLYDCGSKEERKYDKLPIEQKESYKWIRTAENFKELFEKSDCQATIVADRECDIYDFYVKVPTEKINALIRVRTNRRLKGGGNLYEKLAASPVCATYELELNRRKEKKRTARINVSFTEVELEKPDSCNDENIATSVRVWVIQAKESPESTPSGSKPIDWKLISTRPITSAQEAMEHIGYYEKRWLIEEFFRTIKTDGFNIEATQLSKGDDIRKLTVLVMIAAIRTLQLKAARDQSNYQAHDVFEEEEVELMSKLLPKVEGKTQKLKNPHPTGSLSWATWIIARLGGWDGYKSQRPPGVITLNRGLCNFRIRYETWMMFKNDF